MMKYLNKHLIENQSTMNNRFSEITKKKRAYHGRYPLIDFGIGESNHEIAKEVFESFKLETQKNENYGYTDNDDYGFLEAAKNYLYKCHDLSVNDSNLAPSLGTKGALCLLAELLVTEGDLVIVTTPGYNVFENAVKRRGGEVYRYHLNEENDYRIDIDKIDKEILKRAKVMLINYPNNPTSIMLEAEEYRKLYRVLKKYHILLINDAAYIDVTKKRVPSLFEAIPLNSDALELYTLSKSHNMTGLRLGFVVGNETLISSYLKLKEHNDSGSFLPCLLAGKSALENFTFLNDNKFYYTYRREMLQNFFDTHKFKYVKSEATFYIYVKVPKKFNSKGIKNASEFTTLLLGEYGIFTIPYDEDNHVRFSLTYKGKTFDVIKDLEYRLRNVIVEYK